MNAQLHDAAKRGDIESVVALLDAGVSINDLDKHNQTALMNAAFLGHTDLVRVLVDKAVLCIFSDGKEEGLL